MSIRCIAVDDESLALAVVENHIKKVSDLELLQTFDNAIAAFEFLQQHKVDLVFLDVEMPNLTGIDFLKTLENPPKAIITSAKKDYAADGFELNVVDYIIKPVTFERFLKAINKFKKYHDTEVSGKEKTLKPNAADKSEKQKPFIYVNENKKMVKIMLSDILYIESIKDYVKIYTKEKTVMTKQQLSYFEENFPKDQFLRVHRSFLIALNKVEAFNASLIEINKKELPIGRSYKTEVLEILNNMANL